LALVDDPFPAYGCFRARDDRWRHHGRDAEQEDQRFMFEQQNEPHPPRRASLSRRAVMVRSATALAAIGLDSLAATASATSGSGGAPRRGVPMTQKDATRSAGDSGYVTVSDGLELYYERHGTTGEPLLLLHGGLMTSASNWGAFVPALSERYQVIMVDLEGHGHTALIDRPLRYEQMADDASTLLGALGVERANVLGYSLGGGVALQFAVRHPEQVRNLVLVSTPFKTAGWAPEILAAMASMNEDVAAQMEATPMHEAYAAVAPNPDDWAKLVTSVSRLLTSPETAYDWTAGVESLTMPVMLIVGDADSLVPEHLLEFFRLIGGWVVGDVAPKPAAQLQILPGTSHLEVYLRSDLLLATVIPFLDAPLPEAAGTPVD
jgi:pimeloyl-ACP methyl ester carboxylesterase